MKTVEADSSPVRMLFPRLASGAFVRDYYPDKPLVVHGPVSRFGALLDDPRIRDPHSLILASTVDTVIAYLHTASGRHQARVTKQSALELFDHGSTVDVSAVNLILPALGQFTRELRTELGLEHSFQLGNRAAQIMCDAIVSGPGDAVPKHFDCVETLSVQLTGKKIWKIAKAEVEYPAHPFFPGLPYNRRDGQFYPAYFPRSLSKTMPEDARRVVLKPGSVAFLPRGYWHETQALEPSISLSFVLKTPTWGDVVGSAVDKLLENSPHWRAPIPYANAEQRARASREFAGELRRLMEELALTPDGSILPASVETYATAPTAKVSFQHHPRRRAAPWSVLIASKSDGEVEVEADEHLAALIRWIAERKRPFTKSDLESQLEGSDPAKVVAALLDTGLIAPLQNTVQP